MDVSKQLYQEFEHWIKENGNGLFYYIYHHVKHKELAEDLYQDVLVAGYLALPNFQYRSSLKSWMYTIAMNKCRDFWRKEQKAQKYWNEVVKYTAYESEYGIPEDETIEKNTQEEMKKKIEELPNKYSEPLLLFYYEEKTIDEISSLVEIPINTVKTRMRRAKLQLKERFDATVGL